MRSIGIASRALDLMMERVSDPIRKTFGKELREHGTVLSDIARSRAEIDQARLLVLSAARKVDTHGAKAAMKEIGIAKVCPFLFVLPTSSSPFHRTISSLTSHPLLMPPLPARCSCLSLSSIPLYHLSLSIIYPSISFIPLSRSYETIRKAQLMLSSPSPKWLSR
jgi:hypothetical protein